MIPSQGLDAIHGALGLMFVLVPFGLALVQSFLAASNPLFWNGNPYSVPLYIETV